MSYVNLEIEREHTKYWHFNFCAKGIGMNNDNNILADILRIALPQNGETVRLGNSKFVIKDNILREIGLAQKVRTNFFDIRI